MEVSETAFNTHQTVPTERDTKSTRFISQHLHKQRKLDKRGLLRAEKTYLWINHTMGIFCFSELIFPLKPLTVEFPLINQPALSGEYSDFKTKKMF